MKLNRNLKHIGAPKKLSGAFAIIAHILGLTRKDRNSNVFINSIGEELVLTMYGFQPATKWNWKIKCDKVNKEKEKVERENRALKREIKELNFRLESGEEVNKLHSRLRDRNEEITNLIDKMNDLKTQVKEYKHICSLQNKKCKKYAEQVKQLKEDNSNKRRFRFFRKNVV